jgi:hypothetical protein
MSNFYCELNDYREELIRRGFFKDDSEINNAITGSIHALRSIHAMMEVRRGN